MDCSCEKTCPKKPQKPPPEKTQKKIIGAFCKSGLRGCGALRPGVYCKDNLSACSEESQDKRAFREIGVRNYKTPHRNYFKPSGLEPNKTQMKSKHGWANNGTTWKTGKWKSDAIQTGNVILIRKALGMMGVEKFSNGGKRRNLSCFVTQAL